MATDKDDAVELPILTQSEIWQLSVPERLFSYADAYRRASTVLCQKMKEDSVSFTWPNAAVVLMLAAHALELFLKGALLKKNPTLNVWSHRHNLDRLKEEYKANFQDPMFKWDIPFTCQLTPEEWIAGMMELNPGLTEEDLRGVKPIPPPPSIMYRYPVDQAGKEWRGLYGFEPHSFSILLSQLEFDFERIKSQIV